MKVKVVVQFLDKNDHSVIYKEGTVVEFDDARAKDIIKRGFAVPVKETGKGGKNQPKAEQGAPADPAQDAAKQDAAAEGAGAESSAE